MKKTKKYFTLDNIIVYLSIILFVYTFFQKTFQNDFFFDVKTGEAILKYGVDFVEHFSFIPNLTYLYHHWLYDLILYFIFNKLGYFGVALIFIIIFLIFSIIYYKLCLKITSSKIFSLFTTLVLIFFANYAFQTRVQSITYLLFLLEVIYLNKIYNDENTKLYIILMIINSVIIVNFHMPIWILTIILALPFIVEMFLFNISKKHIKFKNFINKYITLEGPKDSNLFLSTFILIILSGLISPYKLYPYYFFIKAFLSNGFYIFSIGELQPVVLFYDYFTLILLILLILGLYFKILKIKFRDFLLIIGLFIFGLIAVRNVIYFLIFAPLVILKGYYNSDKKISIKLFDKLKTKVNLSVLKSSILIGIICVLFGALRVINYKEFDFYISDNFPVDAVKYIKDNLDYKNLKFYSEFNYGSYMAFNDISIFVDSRAEVYIKEFNGGKDIANDYKNIHKLNKYKNIFKKYEFDYALVYKESTLDYILTLDDNFENIYDDDSFVIYKVNKEMYLLGDNDE